MAAFKVKEKKYYKDRKGRIYGPMTFTVSAFGAENNYFSAPGHTLTWSDNGLAITTSRLFMGNPRDVNYDLVERVRVRKS